jgi:hypothetical protein
MIYLLTDIFLLGCVILLLILFFSGIVVFFDWVSSKINKKK